MIESEIKEITEKFVWGPVVEVHEIGEYAFIEYHPQIFTNGSGTGEYDYDTTMFSAYINGGSIGRSYETLDKALIGVIAYKEDGPNTRADGYFYSMIGI